MKKTETEKQCYIFKAFFEKDELIKITKQQLNFMQLCAVRCLLEKEIERMKKVCDEKSKPDDEISGVEK